MSGPKRGAIAVTGILRVALDITDLSNGGTVLEVNRGGVARVFGDTRRQIADLTPRALQRADALIARTSLRRWQTCSTR